MTVSQRLEPSEERGKLHVVVLPYPAKGHSIPLLHFAEQLHSMGVVVTFINTFNHLPKEHFRSINGLSAGMQVVPLGVPTPGAEGKSLPYIQHVGDLVPDAELLFEQLFAENEDAPPACIVSDVFLGWTQVVANKFNIPKYVLFSSSASALATILHMPELIRQGLLPIDPSKKEELVCDIPGVPPTRLADLPSPMQDSKSFIYSFFERNASAMHEATGVLINSFYELEPFYTDALRQTTYGNGNGEEGHLLSILPVGPLLPNAYFSTSTTAASEDMGESDPCLQWLDTQPDSSVLYVSFGSVAVLSIAQIHELALGLEASEQRFLMVLRSPANPENLPLLPEGFEERTKGRGFVLEGWAPQLCVLSHRAVGGFLTHCGWNSTLESICRGVPMLAWPMMAEQAMNARFLVDDVKSAMELRRVTDAFITKEQIAEGVKFFMMEGTIVRNNVQKLQSLAMKAVSEGGSVQNNLEDFLEELRSRKRVRSIPVEAWNAFSLHC